MIPPPAKTTWIWITAAPLLLMLLGAVTPIGSIDWYWLVSFGLSLLIGVVALVMLIVLRAKHKLAFSQPTVWISLVLACLDIAIPIMVILFLFYFFSHFSR